MKVRESWGSRLGFILAVAGSAVGLANIWRFPYVVGSNGGAAFIVVYLLFLAIIGLPVFLSEIVIGRATHTSPSGAFAKLGGSSSWSWAGKMTIATGFIVSAFYSAIAGWIVGYLFEAVMGHVTHFETTEAAAQYYVHLMSRPLWGLSFHGLFMIACTFVLFFGIKRGIERGTKIMMPLLFFTLVLLVGAGLMMPEAERGLRFLLEPDWNALTPTALITALGQAFFTLSLGQGTMVTYGSYLRKDVNILRTSIPIIAMDLFVSLLSAVAVFTIVFSAGMAPNAGPSLLFQTLPWVFSQLPGGYLLAISFFLLVTLAAITSEISALQPTITYLRDEWGWKRSTAVLTTCGASFLLGLPCAMSLTLYGKCILGVMEWLASSIFIPLGGFAAVIVCGWVWGADRTIAELESNEKLSPWISVYLRVSLRYTAPILIVIVFLKSIFL